MLVSALNPACEGRVQFSRSALSSLPESAGCYAISAYGQEILYLGQSKNVHDRVRQHLDSGEKSGQTPWGLAFWLDYILCERQDLDNVERGWVMQYRLSNDGEFPYFNKVSPPA